jgi:hypothetical protein
MKYPSIIIIACMVGFTTLHAQTTECIDDFNFLIKKIQADYPGYYDKVKPENSKVIDALEKELRDKIVRYPDSCSYYLKQYASWFKDNHLRVGKVETGRKPPEKGNVSSYGQKIEFDLNEFKRKTSQLGTIEGIWTSLRGDIALMKSAESNTLLGVAINYRDWEPNQVIFELTPLTDSTFKVKQHTMYKDRSPREGEASLHLNNTILEIHDDNNRFVRKTNSSHYDNAIIQSYVPQFPNGLNNYFVALCLSDSTFYMRIPGFYGIKDQIEKTLSNHWSDIMSRPNMIIDIRYNSGGLDNEYQELLKLMYTNPYSPKGVEWYASPGNIKLFEDALEKKEIRDGEEGIRRTNALLSAMRKNVGGFVVHPDNLKKSDVPATKDTVYKYPKRVGIIINEGNASSAEQFLLSAKDSKKVTLFGNQSTAGVLDYSNAVSVDFPSGKYQLTFPMTRSQRLPENPIDNIGIKPDINIPYPSTLQLYDRLDNWVYFVKDYLEFSETKN